MTNPDISISSNLPKFIQEKLILALDLPDESSAKKMISQLGDDVIFYKLGLELMMSGGYFSLLNFLKSQNKKIFADLKLYDIPKTVSAAVKNLANFEIDFLTIHSANSEIMCAASANKGKMKILAVTILTALSHRDLAEMGFDTNISLEELVVKKAELALKSGADGVVASALEAKILRQKLGYNFLIITPGIREVVDNSAFKSAEKASKSTKIDDQKRVSDVSSALKNGASHLVIGRPITSAQNPQTAAKLFLHKINEACRIS